MAGVVANLSTEGPLLEEDYGRGRTKRKTKHRTKHRTKKRTNSSSPSPERAVSFKTVQAKIAKKDGVPMKNAGAILANASRTASPAAKKKNPKLTRVKGKAKGKAKGKKSASSGGPSRIAQAMGAGMNYSAANC